MYALDHYVSRLADEHNLADFLGQEFAKLIEAKAVRPVETNIVILDMKNNAPTAFALVELLRAEGLLMGAFGERRVRIVTHIGVDMVAVERLVQTLIEILGISGK